MGVAFFVNGKLPLWLWFKIGNLLMIGIPSMTASSAYTIYVVYKLFRSSTKSINNIAHVVYTILTTTSLICLFALITLKSSLSACVLPIMLLSVVVAVGEGAIYLHQKNTHVEYTRSNSDMFTLEEEEGSI